MTILSIGELLGMGPSELSGLIPYSGLEYSGSVITGISGSALGGQGGTDSATVSAIASAYAESAASSKVDQSAFNDCCSSVNSALSGISAAVSGVTGNTGTYIPASASGDFAPSFALSGKLDNSASSTWYPMEGNPSGFLTEHQSLSGYATEEYVDSSVSGKQDASGMSAYATTGDISAKLDASAVNFDGDSSHVTGISGVPLSATGAGGDCKIVYDASGNIYNSGAENYPFKWGSGVIYGSANSARVAGVIVGIGNTADAEVVIGNNNSARASGTVVGCRNRVPSDTFPSYILGDDNTSRKGDAIVGGSNSGDFILGYQNTGYVSIGEWNSAGYIAIGSACSGGYEGIAVGHAIRNSNNQIVMGRYNIDGSSDAFVIGDGTYDDKRHNLMLVTKDGEITMYSSTADTTGIGIVSSIRALSASVTGNDCKIVYDANGNIYNSGAGNSVGYYGGAIIYGSGNSGGDGATAFGYNNTALGDGISIGVENSANFMAVAIGSGNIIHGDSFGIGIGSDNSGSEGDILLGRGNSSYEGHAIGWGNTAYYAKLWGEYLDGSGCYGIGKYNLSGDHNVAFVIGDGTFSTARHDLMVISKSGEVTMYSGTADTVGLPLVATLRALSAWATANGWTGM